MTKPDALPRPVGTEITYTYAPDVTSVDTDGHYLHSHEWTYRVAAHVEALVGRRVELVEQLEPVRERCRDDAS